MRSAMGTERGRPADRACAAHTTFPYPFGVLWACVEVRVLPIAPTDRGISHRTHIGHAAQHTRPFHLVSLPIHSLSRSPLSPVLRHSNCRIVSCRCTSISSARGSSFLSFSTVFIRWPASEAELILRSSWPWESGRSQPSISLFRSPSSFLLRCSLLSRLAFVSGA